MASAAEELARVYGANVYDLVGGLQRLAARIERYATVDVPGDPTHVEQAIRLVDEVTASLGNLGIGRLLRSALQADAARGKP
jgi:hypothetical protein